MPDHTVTRPTPVNTAVNIITATIIGRTRASAAFSTNCSTPRLTLLTTWNGTAAGDSIPDRMIVRCIPNTSAAFTPARFRMPEYHTGTSASVATASTGRRGRRQCWTTLRVVIRQTKTPERKWSRASEFFFSLSFMYKSHYCLLNCWTRCHQNLQPKGIVFRCTEQPESWFQYCLG